MKKQIAINNLKSYQDFSDACDYLECDRWSDGDPLKEGFDKEIKLKPVDRWEICIKECGNGISYISGGDFGRHERNEIAHTTIDWQEFIKDKKNKDKHKIKAIYNQFGVLQMHESLGHDEITEKKENGNMSEITVYCAYDIDGTLVRKIYPDGHVIDYYNEWENEYEKTQKKQP